MIVNSQRRIPVAIKPLQLFYERVRKELRFPPESVTIRLISDDAMSRLNQTFRKKRGPTDVLSFPASRTRPKEDTNEDMNADMKYVGDIAISPETARCNARRFARTFGAEMRILVLHGMIHLAGFDHEADHGEMNRLERRLRLRLGIVSPRGKKRVPLSRGVLESKRRVRRDE
jgi:probable rRNA maturation factor